MHICMFVTLVYKCMHMYVIKCAGSFRPLHILLRRLHSLKILNNHNTHYNLLNLE